MGVIGAYVVELAPTISVKAIVSTLIPVISEQVPRICISMLRYRMKGDLYEN